MGKLFNLFKNKKKPKLNNTLIVFIRFLKENDAYKKYIVRITHSNNLINKCEVLEYLLKTYPSFLISGTFSWQSEEIQYWRRLDNKWKSICTTEK